MAASHSNGPWVVVTPLGSSTLVLSLEGKSALSRTKRRVMTRILINPGQGCQRRLVCEHISTQQISTVLATQCSPSYISGFPGVYFAMADGGAGTLDVRGPNGTSLVCDSWRAFVKRKFPALKAKDSEGNFGSQIRVETRDGFILASVSLKPERADAAHVPHSMCVWCMIQKSHQNSASEADSDNDDVGDDSSKEDNAHHEGASVDESSEAESENGIDVPVEEIDHEINEEQEHTPFGNPESEGTVICYLISFNDGPIVAVLDSRNQNDVQLLCRNPHLQFPCELHRPRLLCHLLPTALTVLPEYQAWMSSYTSKSGTDLSMSGLEERNTPQHLFLCRSQQHSNSYADSTKWICELGTILPELFHIPEPAQRESKKAAALSYVGQGLSATFRAMEINHVDGEDMDVIPQLDAVQQLTNEDDRMELDDPSSNKVDDVADLNAKKLKRDVFAASDVTIRTVQSTRRDEVDHFPYLLMLGTGAAKPSPLRGLSSILFCADPLTSILLDVGEDWRYQLSRLYPDEKIERENAVIEHENGNGIPHQHDLIGGDGMKSIGQLIGTIKMVWVSHHHLDHHGGLVEIIQEKINREEPLLVVVPNLVRTFIENVFRRSALNQFIQINTCEEYANLTSSRRASTEEKASAKALDRSLLESKFKDVMSMIEGTCRVDHCFDAHAICLRYRLPVLATSTAPNMTTTTSPNQRGDILLLYSGDTRPCPRKLSHLVSKRGAGDQVVLIHEATFGDDKQGEAREKRHSTLEEAASVAYEINAQLLIATHASQRYPRGVPLAADRYSDPFPILQAHDLMRICLKDLQPRMSEVFKWEKKLNAIAQPTSSQGESSHMAKGHTVM